MFAFSSQAGRGIWGRSLFRFGQEYHQGRLELYVLWVLGWMSGQQWSVPVECPGTQVVTLHGEFNFPSRRHPEETDWALTLIFLLSAGCGIQF